MSSADRRVHKGRPVVTRVDLMREVGVDRSTAENWYALRGTNGHPGPVLADGRSLYFDEAALREWVREQLDPPCPPPRIVRDGRTLVTRSELARLTGLAETALRDVYANRTITGHPEVVHRDRRALYFDECECLTWHAGRMAARPGRGRRAR